jgi:hypothetical protein
MTYFNEFGQARLGWNVGTPSGGGGGNSIITNGLILNLDAGNSASYPGTGTTWTDLSGQNNNGTLVTGPGNPGPTWSSTDGGIFSFDGVNDYVDLSTKLRLNDSDLTYDFWVKFNRNTNVYDTVFCQASPNFSNYIQFVKNRSGLVDGKLAFAFQGQVIYDNLTGSQVVSSGILNYTCVLKKESSVYKMLLYRNGVLISQLTTSISSYNMTAWSNFQTNVGRGTSLYPDPLNGNIYINKMYNKALSASEITQNFNTTKTRFGL